MVHALLRGFNSGFTGFPASTKSNTPNSNSTRIEDPPENQLRLIWLLSKYCNFTSGVGRRVECNLSVSEKWNVRDMKHVIRDRRVRDRRTRT